MWANCVEYNGCEHDIYRQAQELAKLFDDRFEALITPPQRMGLRSPVMDVPPARLDRERDAKRTRDPRRGSPVGIEELRLDQVERGLGMQPPGQRQHAARDPHAGRIRQFRRRRSPTTRAGPARIPGA